MLNKSNACKPVIINNNNATYYWEAEKDRSLNKTLHDPQTCQHLVHDFSPFQSAAFLAAITH